MKKIQLITFAGIAVFVFLAAFAVSERARAEQDNNNNGSNGMNSSTTMMNSGEKKGNMMGEFENDWKGANGLGFGTGQESAIVRPNGDFRVTGATANSVDVSAATVNATLFGLNRTVSLSGARIVGGGQAIALSDIKAGDKINALGNYNATAHIATVSQVMDISYSNRQTTDIQSRIQQLLRLVEQLQAQLKALQQH